MTRTCRRIITTISALVVLGSCSIRPLESQYAAQIRKAQRIISRNEDDLEAAIPTLRLTEQRIIELKRDLMSLPPDEAWMIYEKVENVFLRFESFVRDNPEFIRHTYIAEFLNSIGP